MASSYRNLFYDNDFYPVITINYNLLLDMLDNDNIMIPKASEVVQNVSTDKKMILVRYSFHIATTYSVEKV